MENYKSNLLEELSKEISIEDQKKTDVKMLLAAKIADAIAAKGWSKADLMRAVNVKNQSIITKWLSGTQNFTVDTLVSIGHALGIGLLNTVIEANKPTTYIGFVVGSTPSNQKSEELGYEYKERSSSSRVQKIIFSFQSNNVQAEA